MFFVYYDVLHAKIIHVIHQSMCINVSYNKYALNNTQKRQNFEKNFKKT
jgi:hypothetical protein